MSNNPLGDHDRAIINPDQPKQRRQLVVTHNNENVTYYPVGHGKPWKVDSGLQLLIIGKGIGRMMVPLCNIMYFTLEEY